MMLLKNRWLLIFVLFAAEAKDFGVQGHVFEITEPDLLHVIEGKLHTMQKTGEITHHQKKLLQKTKARIYQPSPITHITRAQTPRQWTYDPTWVVPTDLKDHKGQIFARQGETVNPLDFVPLTTPLLFFDGDDPEQITWARAQEKAQSRDLAEGQAGDHAEGQAENCTVSKDRAHLTKWILTKGAPLVLSKQENRSVFFDQGGIITKKWGITHVPCRVSQKENLLFLEEYVLERKRVREEFKKEFTDTLKNTSAKKEVTS